VAKSANDNVMTRLQLRSVLADWHPPHWGSYSHGLGDAWREG